MAFASSSSTLTNIVAAILVIGFGILVGNILSLIAKKILENFEVEHILQNYGIRFPLQELLSSFLKYGIYLAALILGVGFLGLEKVFLFTILFIILGLLILFILISFKDFIPNFIAGMILFMKKRIRVGESIEITGIEGKVVHIDMIETKIRTVDGDVVVIPNGLLLRSPLTRKKK